MKKKERTLTLYFDADDPVYNKLMNMNKFSRAEYIRTALREAVAKGMMMTVSADGIKVIYAENTGNKEIMITDSISQLSVIKTNKKQPDSIDNTFIDLNKSSSNNIEKISNMEENSDPFSII